MSRFAIKRSKIIIPLMCLAQCVILVLLQNPTAVLKDSIVPLHFSYSNVSVVSTDDGGNYIVGDFWSGSTIRNRLTDLKIRSIDGIFINKLDENVVRQIKVLRGTFADFEVYFPLENATDEAVDLLKQNKSIKFSKFSKSEGFDENSSEGTTRIVLPAGFHAAYEDGLFRAYGMEHDDVSIIFIPFGKNYTLFQSISRYGVIRTNHYFPLDAEAVFLVNNSDSVEPAVVSSTLFADYAFDFKSGEVYIPKTTIFG